MLSRSWYTFFLKSRYIRKKHFLPGRHRARHPWPIPSTIPAVGRRVCRRKRWRSLCCSRPICWPASWLALRAASTDSTTCRCQVCLPRPPRCYLLNHRRLPLTTRAGRRARANPIPPPPLPHPRPPSRLPSPRINAVDQRTLPPTLINRMPANIRKTSLLPPPPLLPPLQSATPF